MVSLTRIYLSGSKGLTINRAGITDSALTNHGVLQIEHLGQYFASQSVHFDSVFASDLGRARITAEGICRHQPRDDAPLQTPILTPDLRERDFGSLEGEKWTASAATSGGSALHIGHAGGTSAHIESESKASMKGRAASFLNEYIIPLFFDDLKQEVNIAIVSHGTILRVLWSCLVELLDPMQISIAPGIALWNGEPAAFISPVWSNTGYMTLSIQQSHSVPEESMEQESTFHASDSAMDVAATTTPSTETSVPVTFYLLHGWSMKVLTIDSKDHLSGLRRTRGGIGSATHDTRQKRIDQFFK